MNTKRNCIKHINIQKMKTRIDSLATQEEEYTYFLDSHETYLKAKNNKGYSWCGWEIIDVPSAINCWQLKRR